jgi:DNA-binding Xre family transcriptional regulator
MMARLDYRWHLRRLMAERKMFATTDLAPLLEQRGITLSTSQVYRLVTERPERLSLTLLMALLDILGCEMGELIEPVAAARPARPARTATGEEPGIGTLRPRRARIRGADD